MYSGICLVRSVWSRIGLVFSVQSLSLVATRDTTKRPKQPDNQRTGSSRLEPTTDPSRSNRLANCVGGRAPPFRLTGGASRATGYTCRRHVPPGIYLCALPGSWLRVAPVWAPPTGPADVSLWCVLTKSLLYISGRVGFVTGRYNQLLLIQLSDCPSC